MTRIAVLVGADGTVTVYSDDRDVEVRIVDQNVGTRAEEYRELMINPGRPEAWDLTGGFFTHDVGVDPEFVDRVFSVPAEAT